MTALAADNPNLFPAQQYLTWEGQPAASFCVAASTVIYNGGLVGLNTSGNLVMWAPPTVGTSIVGGFRPVGIAREHIASQTDALKRCVVQTGGRFVGALASSTVADIGKPIFATDNATLSKSAISSVYVGRIIDWISATQVVVEMDLYTNGLGGMVAAWSPIISVAAANIVTVIPKSWNANGLYVREVIGVCTTDFSSATPVFTVQDTAGTTLGITFATATTTDAGELMLPVGGAEFGRGTQDAALVLVPAGLGIDIVTTASGTGAAKFWIQCIPGA